jgi:hypothetical protein
VKKKEDLKIGQKRGRNLLSSFYQNGPANFVEYL